ncbi:DDHD domain-containing protein [Rutstroemia sp. NJR-2017a BBW]|nr:DDHD domain-containing protein [Rutstroemia sp. NJR-2017a BBW]
MKNMIVGIPVVRGFDWGSWEKLHPSKKTQNTIKTSHKTGVTAGSKPDCCPACEAQEKVPEYSDLCLVIHGIGQKLSERMESFHFTHAINGFRTEVNRELFNTDVKRDLVFEDGGPNKAGNKDDSESAYTLNDITLPTIPAVRGLICDVMLDIPYYLSKHKPKMIAALIAEANRIYRLWCKNNPGFHKKGRVHLIAHSLGSAMALEVLSKQPTSIPAELSWRTNTKCFDFRTTNCFLAGSPASFFLLLDNAHLCPRKALNKPGAESGDDTREDVVGEVGTFGCLAVDNIYNIMHINDPIAYRLNATVDAPYASSLKVAEVPNSSLSFFSSVGHAFKSLPGISSPTDLGVGQLPKPAMLKMPSQVEMAVHDFSAEEIAEKKFYLLNDNGQDALCGGGKKGREGEYVAEYEGG